MALAHTFIHTRTHIACAVDGKDVFWRQVLSLFAAAVSAVLMTLATCASLLLLPVSVFLVPMGALNTFQATLCKL